MGHPLSQLDAVAGSMIRGKRVIRTEVWRYFMRFYSIPLETTYLKLKSCIYFVGIAQNGFFSFLDAGSSFLLVLNGGYWRKPCRHLLYYCIILTFDLVLL